MKQPPTLSKLHAGLHLALCRALTELRRLQRAGADAASLRDAERDLESAVENLAAFTKAMCETGGGAPEYSEPCNPLPYGPTLARAAPPAEYTQH